ncbi:hypothetical protein LAZ67_20002119 [Cordylochernes scorpioides]|uniref:Uncharacterized protein n=1 Tax=Cordylochernes scorpioides TaxID=51811 RepID=A0ABY6LN09_9ARAC|nr:hypothetical protein LAZ67_20002119 [Cordylochernes scorpioides]
MTLKGRRFSLSSEVIENATVELNKLRKFDFELAFQQLFSRWKKMKPLGPNFGRRGTVCTTMTRANSPKRVRGVRLAKYHGTS